MKKYIFIFALVSLVSLSSYSQGGAQNILFTAKPNAVLGLDIYAKNISGADISGNIGASTLTLCVLVPASISPQPVATITSPIAGVTFGPVVQLGETTVVNGTTYDVYTFNGATLSAAAVDFPSNTEVLVATYLFNNSPIATSTTLLATLPAGGSSGFDYCYIAPGGTDQTDYANPFYSDIPSDANLHNANGLNDFSLNSLSYLGIANVILPVKFTAFSVVKKGDNALLNWSAVNENTAGTSYEVERSLNGADFTTIATVPVKDNSTGNTYTYTDNNLSSLGSTGTIYYRIEQVDKSGTPSYTDIKAVSINGVSVSAYPNPVKDVVSVTVNLLAASNVSIDVSDLSGKQLQEIQIAGTKGINIEKINLAGYAAGSYLLKVNTGTITTLSVVKE
jgi:hypothetical protein